MAVEYATDLVRFVDVVDVSEADALLAWASGVSAPAVDFAACTHLHAANLQVLMAAGATVVAWPAEPVLRDWLTGCLSESNPKQD